MRSRSVAHLALALATVACGPPARTFAHDVVGTVDLGDAIGVLLDDGSVVVAPDDRARPSIALGRVEGAPRFLVHAGELLLATSAVDGHDRVQAFSRTDRSVRGVAQGTVVACGRERAPVIYERREDAHWFGRELDPATLAPTARGVVDSEAEMLRCEGDAGGFVVEDHTVVYDAPEYDGLTVIDQVASGPRSLRLPGRVIAWHLHGDSVIALVMRGTEPAPGLWRIPRWGSDAATEIQHGLRAAEHVVVGETYACVSDAADGPGAVRRVALDGGATDLLLEGSVARCVGVRGDRVVVLRDHRTLEILPP